MSDDTRDNVIPFGKVRNKYGDVVDEEAVYGDKNNSQVPLSKVDRDRRLRTARDKANRAKASNKLEPSETLGNGQNTQGTPEVSISVTKYKDKETSGSSPSSEIVSAGEEGDEGAVTSYANRSPKQLTRQERVYELSVVYGMANVAIAAKLGISNNTVANDLYYETTMRLDEAEANRPSEKLRQLMLCQDLINRGRESRNNPGTGAFAAMTKGIEMRAKLLGLDAPTRMEIGVVNLLEAIDILPRDEQATAWQRVVSQPTGVLGAADQATAGADQAGGRSGARDPYDPHAREPSQAILEAVVTGVRDSPVLPLGDLLSDGEGQGDTLRGSHTIPPASADDIRKAQVRAAAADAADQAAGRADQDARLRQIREAQGADQGPPIQIRTDPRTNVVTVRDRRPLVDQAAADPILANVRATSEAAKRAAQSREQAREGELVTTHQPGGPPLPQAGPKAKHNPDAAAIAVMANPLFLMLSPAMQRQAVDEARAAASEGTTAAGVADQGQPTADQEPEHG